MTPESDWIASRIVETAGSASGPFRIVWNGGTIPGEVERALLESGLPMTAAMDAPRMEITQHTSPAGDIDLHVRLLDASGAVLASDRYRRPSDLPAWRRAWMRVASPVLVTTATGITVYLLYNVRSR